MDQFWFLCPTYLEEKTSFTAFQTIDKKYLVKSDTAIFVSHLWLSRNDPDPTRNQFNWLKARKFGIPLFYDYCCLPQRHLKMPDSPEFVVDKEDCLRFGGRVFSSEYQVHVSMKSELLRLVRRLPDLLSSRGVSTLSICTHPNSYSRGWPYFEMMVAGVFGVIHPESLSKPRDLITYLSMKESSWPLSLVEKVLRSPYLIPDEMKQVLIHRLDNCVRDAIEMEEFWNLQGVMAEKVSRGYIGPGKCPERFSDPQSKQRLRELAIEYMIIPKVIMDVEKHIFEVISVELCFKTFTNGADGQMVRDSFRGKLRRMSRGE
jgi:hypothetical protein